jgi:hypothetical protein
MPSSACNSNREDLLEPKRTNSIGIFCASSIVKDASRARLNVDFEIILFKKGIKTLPRIKT